MISLYSTATNCTCPPANRAFPSQNFSSSLLASLPSRTSIQHRHQQLAKHVSTNPGSYLHLLQHSYRFLLQARVQYVNVTVEYGQPVVGTTTKESSPLHHGTLQGSYSIGCLYNDSGLSSPSQPLLQQNQPVLLFLALPDPRWVNSKYGK
jgi:hypothetical protein